MTIDFSAPYFGLFVMLSAQVTSVLMPVIRDIRDERAKMNTEITSTQESLFKVIEDQSLLRDLKTLMVEDFAVENAIFLEKFLELMRRTSDAVPKIDVKREKHRLSLHVGSVNTASVLGSTILADAVNSSEEVKEEGDGRRGSLIVDGVSPLGKERSRLRSDPAIAPLSATPKRNGLFSTFSKKDTKETTSPSTTLRPTALDAYIASVDGANPENVKVPPSLIQDYIAFYETFLKPESALALNVASKTYKMAAERIKSGNLHMYYIPMNFNEYLKSLVLR